MSWEEARAALEATHQAREEALRQCRALIQTSSKCIRHIHRRQFEEAKALLDQARHAARTTRQALADRPAVLYAGYVQDSEKEMVEAAMLLAMADGKALPSQAELGVDAPSWLNGAVEAASELRRYLLDCLRRGEHDEARRLLEVMEGVYDEVVSLDFPDAVTGGLRRTTDAFRAVLERTRGDLTMTLLQQQLVDELRRR